MQHLMRSTARAERPERGGTLAHAKASHPAGTARTVAPAEVTDTPRLVAAGAARITDEEDGSLVTEYGLLAVVAATIAGVVMTWASGGALVTLFNALLRQARSLVGA
jgi:Flp pilus assembly pilin Flp